MAVQTLIVLMLISSFAAVVSPATQLPDGTASPRRTTDPKEQADREQGTGQEFRAGTPTRGMDADARMRRSISSGRSSPDSDSENESAALKSSPSFQRSGPKRRRTFVDYEAPKVFKAVCDYEKVKRGDTDRHVTCNEQCLDIPKRVAEISEKYPNLLGLDKIRSDCMGFTKGTCVHNYKRGKYSASLCKCWDLTDLEEPKGQYAAVCRAALSGFQIANNAQVLTRPVTNMVKRWRSRSRQKAAERKKSINANSNDASTGGNV